MHTDCHTPKIFGPQGPKLDKTKSFSGASAEVKLVEFNPAIVQPCS